MGFSIKHKILFNHRSIMKLTKFAQSCFLLEDAGQKTLIDPGYIQVDEKAIQAWMHPDFILVTHKHQDHFDEESVKKILSPKTRIFATKETASFKPNTKFEILKEGEKITLGKVKVEVVRSIHGYHPGLKGGKEVNEGVGFIIDTEKKKIYHTGDTICFNNNYKCNILLLPFNNHGVVMGPFEAAMFAKETGAELVIPIHYDNPALPADILRLEKELTKNSLTYKFLKIGESIEV